MTDTYEGLETRLRVCLEFQGRPVPERAPQFDRMQLPHGRRHSLLRRRGLSLVAAAMIASLVAVGLASSSASTPRSELIAATEATIGAHTARVRLTSMPSVAMEVGQNAVAMTATGVVDFAVPSMEAAYPDGYSWIDIANRSWQTLWPARAGGAEWELSRSPTEPRGTGAAQQELADALQADTGPAALLAALRSRSQRVTRLGTQTVDGLRAAHYRANVGKMWSAEVWVANQQLVRLEVEGPSGSLNEEYYDFGVPVHITAPEALAH